MRNFKNFQKNCQHIESLTFLRAVTFMFYPLKPQSHTWGAAAQKLKENFKKCRKWVIFKRDFPAYRRLGGLSTSVTFSKIGRAVFEET